MSTTINLSQITIGGPCKLVDPSSSSAIYFERDVKITPKPVWRDIPSSVAGDGDDQVLVDLTYEITGTPKAVWTSDCRATLLPSTLHGFSVTGASLIGAANRSVSIVGADGAGFTFTRAILTKMPEVYLGLGGSLYGAATWTAFIGNGNALTDTNAFYATNTTAWAQTDYPTTLEEELCTAAWGSVSGFSNIFAEQGFKLTHELKLNPVKQGNITVDMRVAGYRGMFSFLPQQPTTAQLLTALAYQGSGGGIGTRRSSNAANLVVTGLSGASITLNNSAPKTGEFVFDNKLNRHGQFAFISALSAPGARLAFS